ncbi:MAG: CaiB/BaiF CoA-transferase family protein [Candidatus Geothermincolales bacterium]
MAPLEGIRVLDFSQLYPGPLCTMILADLGAEVIKVEPVGLGDPARLNPYFFRQINRNKKSVALNLKDERCRKAMLSLSRKVDVVVEGFRPGTMSRLGVDYEALGSQNPRLVFCSISGFGQDGPYRDRPGHDINYLALAGVLGLTRDREGKPVVLGLELADIASAMNAALAILAALYARERTGKGQYIDISMLDCSVALLYNSTGSYLVDGKEPEVNLIHATPHYGVFEAADGEPLALGIVHEDWFWDELCEVLGLEDLKGVGLGERFQRKEELEKRVREAFGRRTAREWLEAFEGKDVPITPINRLGEALEDPQVRHRRMVVEIPAEGGPERVIGSPLKLAGTPPEFRRPAPPLGANTREVLLEAGLGEEEVEEMLAQGVAQQP